jgi:hypothetical protein
MLGFRAGVLLEEGLAQTIAWTREHMGQIDDCVQRHASELAAA